MTTPPGGERPQKEVGVEFSFPKGSVYEGEWRVRPPEKPADAAHRRRNENWSFWVKEAPAYFLAILVLSGTAIYCFWILVQRNPPLEEKKWVMSIVTSLVVGIIGFLFGKVTK